MDAVGTGPAGSVVKTLEKKSFKTFAIPLLSLITSPPTFKGPMFDLVLTFDFTYDTNGRLLLHEAMVLSSLHFAADTPFLHSFSALLYFSNNASVLFFQARCF